ncbi:TonB-dependent receptor [Granulicella sp. S156]|jgi:outer membrane receptor protein involved in Fe transport|uniref:TonB-dependent receptor n=1 Tax=Granulicella sp. S156 TaxID=1747224 RepID=UPI00131E7DE7|nr:carboxypeptidase regulatory-like domain-containing protein [Granulicella sp. S156]
MKKFSAISPQILVLVLLFAALLVPGVVSAQNAVTGAITGVVVDPTGALVPGATVKIVDTATNATLKVVTNSEGRYSAPLLKPSKYEIDVTSNGLLSRPTTVVVSVGQIPNVDITLGLAGSNSAVTVSAQAAQLIDTQSPASIMTLTQSQIQNLPAPGGDITTVAYTAPGVVLNSGGAYGNFSSDGLPGTSNLYVLNGYDDEDPFLNLNNSGSSNLTLGQGEISEAAVVQNGYGVQYGRGAGVIINFTTKSGSNKFHGSANYFYNGTVLNANDWFNKQGGGARPHAVSNQWAANVGGPIWKDKLFFFADYEGLHYVLPAQGYVAFPTQAFQNAVLANIPAANVPLYQQAFGLYNASPNFAKAVPVTNGTGLLQDSANQLGCGSAALLGLPDGTGGTFGTTSSCTSSALATGANKNIEWLFTGRVDWNISDKHKIFGRYKMDRGTQPTYTSFVSPLFSTTSSQPSYEGQLNDTYVFTPHVVNQFIFAANWYTAYFGPSNTAATLAAFPTYFASMNDGGSNGAEAYLGNQNLGLSNEYIDGRNVSQYQFVDDLSVIKGNHTLRFGYDFRRNDITDDDAQQNFAGTYALFMGDFANGNLNSVINPKTSNSFGSQFTQQLTNNKSSYLALYNIGVYTQDEWQATQRLKLTFGVRFDRTGNPLCNNDCFSLYNGAFPRSGVTTSTPYSTLVNADQSHPFASVPKINPQARFGFNYDVAGDGRTVIRGGFGMFTDLYPAGFLDGFIANLPNVYNSTITSGSVGSSQIAGSANANSLASFNGVETGFKNQASSSSLTASIPGFAPPGLALAPSEFKNPTYLEFSLQLQHQFTKYDAVILAYAGNTGYDEILWNGTINAASSTGVAGLPTTQPDPNFGASTYYSNAAHSNYNGGSITYKHIDKGLSLNVNYTYSKALDDSSNGGTTNEPYNYNSYYAKSNWQIDPNSVRHLNYSVADYDIRNSLSLDFVYDMPFHFQNAIENQVLGGWIVAGKSFYRSGQPFTVYDSSGASTYTGGTDNSGVLVDILNFHMNRNCGASAARTACFTTADFAASGTQTDFGNSPRNQFTGPHYADTDLTLAKKVYRREALNLEIGANGFNLFNHPNFALPGGDISSPGGLGVISSIAAPPTSPYGSFQGAGIGGRVIQVFGKFSF